MRWVYLSPHLDDAILSCGGIIFEQGQAGVPVEIWNLMSGIPSANLPLSDLARSVHASTGFDSAKKTMDCRLAEDRLAARRVDAFPRYFDFLDSIYRRDENGSPLYTNDIFGPPHPADNTLITQIASLLRENLQADDILVCPLTIGNHPDHVILRRAAEKIEHPLYYYADIPYAIWFPEQLAEVTGNLSVEAYPVSEEGLRFWQEAVVAYASQIAVLFLGEEMMRNGIKSYWRATRGIRLWKIP
ncbi:MAG: hypothetical protein B6I38_07890 [Anaerolineaceae bacterium 4572_5.1]|nr:MAG: hypothetical protein B6I38_07890 [Anaerolineaceae bacterium 4572_5.1]